MVSSHACHLNIWTNYILVESIFRKSHPNPPLFFPRNWSVSCAIKKLFHDLASHDDKDTFSKTGLSWLLVVVWPFTVSDFESIHWYDEYSRDSAT